MYRNETKNNSSNTSNHSNVAHLLRHKDKDKDEDEEENKKKVEDRLPVPASSYINRMVNPVPAGATIYSTGDEKEQVLIPQINVIAGSNDIMDPYMRGFQMRMSDPSCNVFRHGKDMLLDKLKRECLDNVKCMDGYMAADLQRRQEPKCKMNL